MPTTIEDNTEPAIAPDAGPQDKQTAIVRRRWLLLATSLGFAVIQLDVSVVNVAIKPIGAALGGGVSGLQWVVNAYTVAFAALILTAGALGDRIGAKRVFIAGFALFTLASAACGLAPSLPVLIGSRAIQGVGAAILAPTSLTLLNHAFTEPGERTRAVGLWAAGASTALAGGPLIGGVLTSTLGWRAIFFINAPIGLIGILLTIRFASETSRAKDRGVDLPGQLMAIVALASLAGATIEGGRYGFTEAGVLAGYALAALAAAAFVFVEARRERPMLPLELFRSGAFSASSAVGLLVNVTFYGLIFVLSLFFQRGQHLSALQTGLAFAPSTVAVLVANLLAGRLDARYGPRRVIAAGALLMATGAAALIGASTHSPFTALVVQLVGLGFGIGLIVPAMTAAVLASVDRSRSGIASGTLNSARQSGSVIGVALFGALIADGGRLVSGLHVALAISVALAILVGALTIKVPKEPTS
ncbi:MAG: MFS transporter [Solirubrobacterales bacterium]|nr:MFS transporter [Solirubrobacterales bacterium]